MVFCRVFQTRNVDEVGTFQAIAVGDEPRCLGAIARIKMAMVDTIVDDVNGIERHLKKAIDVACRGLADGNDFVLSANKTANASAGVKHPRPIVFVRHVERSEIMNGGNHPARMLPDHSAIARNVQHVESEASGQRWEFYLMPENVLYWGPKFFRNWYQTHVVASEIEEIEVVFEDEKSELVLVGVGQKSFGEREDVLRDARFAVLDDRGGEADFHSPAFRCLKEGN